MDDLKYAGKTQNKAIRISFTWIINNATLLLEMKQLWNLDSPVFPIDEGCAQFYLGLRDMGSEYLNVALLGLSTSNFQDNCKVKFSMKGYNTQQHTIIPMPPIETFPLVKWCTLYTKKNEVLIDDKLVITCEIILLPKPNYKLAKLQTVTIPTCGFVEDIASLLTKKQFHDVTIISGDGHELTANKCILSARSKVLAEMFKQNSQLNSVRMSDFNYDVINVMLQFIYTGQTDRLEAVVEDLIAVAEKYDLKRLKAMCASCLSQKLSIETVATTLKIASLYNEEELKDDSIQFIKMYGKSVAETDNWKNLVASDGKLIVESFIDSNNNDNYT